ncbi:hypothetical protein HAP48_0042635 [Bradyrhizobium septentrionale]|uniref:Uncharacterized protein n=1 Tax=Bradyrhizobium septentrionale TaxID=1404411 RepID=A0A974A2W6_9BRAD|nr:hypothetical protein [Bradyrhizobium septentrionale]UGY15157.1 hypothetical protein HAP48_0042635 [Bradyrhizobium septentrionale]
MSAPAVPSNPHQIYQSAKHERIYIEKDGKLLLSMSFTEWSWMLSRPQPVRDETFDFSR